MYSVNIGLICLHSNKGVFCSVQNDKFLDWSELKALADDKLNLAEKMKFVFRGVEKLWEKEEILVSSIFSVVYSVFQSLLL